MKRKAEWWVLWRMPKAAFWNNCIYRRKAQAAAFARREELMGCVVRLARLEYYPLRKERAK